MRPTSGADARGILDSEGFTDQLRVLADSMGRSPEDVRAEATSHLAEMSATHNPSFVQPWHRLGGWMLRGYDRLIDEEGLASLRALDPEHSLVFLISHRSYLDEWAFPPAIVEQGIRAPFGFAGANMGFFPVGTIARRTGIIHIRRSTTDAPVYKLVLRTFMRHLVARNENLIWSIEGGRSRTGKLRPPRFGLLRYLVDAAEELESSNVLLVPVSIVYDQLPTHEVEVMTAEARGQRKKPEDVKWFLGYLRGLRQRLGRVYVDFGEPIPLRERLAELRADSSTDGTVVERVAVEVSHRINMATPVTPTAIACIALLAADRAMTLDEIVTVIEPLAAYLDCRKVPTAGAAKLNDRATIRRALQDLVQSGVLTGFRGESTVWGMGPGQHLVAAVYRNSAIHVLVERAILEIALLRAAEAPAGQPVSVLDSALRMRDLLKFEFFFPARDKFAANLREELALIDPGTQGDTLELAPVPAEHLAKVDGFTAPLALRPFIDAYSVVAHQLHELGDAPICDEAHFLERCLVLGRQWAMQRLIASEESASAEMFQVALRLAGHLGLRDAGAPDLAARRRAFYQEISGIRDDIARLARRDLPTLVSQSA